jgi:hypothetical protein
MENSDKPAFAASIDENVAPFIGILRDAGRDRERVLLELGTEVATQLDPFSLVVLAMAAGFIIGHGSLQRLQDTEQDTGHDFARHPTPQPQHSSGSQKHP